MPYAFHVSPSDADNLIQWRFPQIACCLTGRAAASKHDHCVCHPRSPGSIPRQALGTNGCKDNRFWIVYRKFCNFEKSSRARGNVSPATISRLRQAHTRSALAVPHAFPDRYFIRRILRTQSVSAAWRTEGSLARLSSCHA